MRVCFFLLTFICVFSISCSTADDVKWVNIVSKEGGYSVNMPYGSKKEDKQETTIFGKQTVHYCSWVPTILGFVKFKLFQLSYTECPASVNMDQPSVSDLLNKGITARMKDYTDEPTEVDSSQLNGYDARSFILNKAKMNTITICKECVANHKKYDLTVVIMSAFANDPAVEQFFNSFQLIKIQ